MNFSFITSSQVGAFLFSVWKGICLWRWRQLLSPQAFEEGWWMCADRPHTSPANSKAIHFCGSLEKKYWTIEKKILSMPFVSAFLQYGVAALVEPVKRMQFKSLSKTFRGDCCDYYCIALAMKNSLRCMETKGCIKGWREENIGSIVWFIKCHENNQWI